VTAAADTGCYLAIRALTKRFGVFTALSDISFDIGEGEFVCFLGPSGCGKTTLLRAIAGLDIQTSGKILQAGRDISALPPSERDFGIVFQSYALFPNLTIRRNVAYGLENAKMSRARITARVNELLELVGLPEQSSKYPAQLSGGQQQRVAVARALATSPGLLLLDEPLSALDAKVRVHLRQELKALQERLGVTTVMVTHDQEEALSMADRIVVMNHGVIEQIGTPTEIYREPETLFVADFIGETNQLEAMVDAPGRLRVGEQVLAADDATQPAGTRTTAVIRPEDILVTVDGTRDGGSNGFDAEVLELAFLGAFWRVQIACTSLSETPLTAAVSANAARETMIAEGMRLRIELPNERLHVFPASP
jgi:iron(III) transport system ATP-binding protein